MPHIDDSKLNSTKKHWREFIENVFFRSMCGGYDAADDDDDMCTFFFIYIYPWVTG